MSMAEVMKRGGKRASAVANEPFNKTRLQRVVSHVTHSHKQVVS